MLMWLLFEMWLDYLFSVLGWDPKTLQYMLNMNISIRNQCDNMHDETWAHAEVFLTPGFGEQETNNSDKKFHCLLCFHSAG